MHASGPRTDVGSLRGNQRGNNTPHPCIHEKEQEKPTWVDSDAARYPTPTETERSPCRLTNEH
jgi:hypothetical protein